MWGPLSKSDERWYKRQAARDMARRERLAILKAGLPRRMKILAMVKSGDITLAEGQRLIRIGFSPNHGVEQTPSSLAPEHKS